MTAPHVIQVSGAAHATIKAFAAAHAIVYGVRAHLVLSSYMQSPQTRRAIVNALGGVYRGCAVDHVTTNPSAIANAIVGTPYPLQALLWNGFGRQLPTRPLSWSSNSGVAIVDTLGVVTTTGAGNAIVSGAASGGRTATVPVAVGTATGN